MKLGHVPLQKRIALKVYPAFITPDTVLIKDIVFQGGDLFFVLGVLLGGYLRVSHANVLL